METVPEFYQFLASMGIGGILAGFAIWMLNRSWKDRVEDQKLHTETIKGYHETERGRTNMLVDVVKEVSTNITKNTVVTESLHRRLDKDAQERG